MQEFEFVDNGVFEKDGVEYRNKGQVEIEDKLFYLFVTSDVPNFAPLYLKDTKKFVVYICDDCGDVIDPDTESVIIRSDSVYCEDCANEEYIHEYSYSPRILFNEGEELNSYPKKGGKIFWARN